MRAPSNVPLLYADIYCSALNPTPPFPRLNHKLRIAGLLALLALGSVIVSLSTVIRAAALVIGLGIFARSPLTWAANWLEQGYPGWSHVLSLQNHILEGMPTNSQLAITLLRNSEIYNSPLAPTPYVDQASPVQPIEISPTSTATSTWDTPLGATQEDLVEAAAPEQSILNAASGPSSEIQETEAREPHRLLGLAKGGVKSAVKIAMRADKFRAKAGRQSATNRLGIIPHRRDAGTKQQGPWTFKARNEGKDGQIHISIDGMISFNKDWSLRASDIKELKKHDGLGLKAKIVVSWAMELDVKDGLEIQDHSGKAYVLTAVAQRDQLFRRLCAIGGQRWDVR